MSSLGAKHETPAIERDPRWAALIGRDRTADGTFYYSVKTTGVYCRPSCGARLPIPGNVRFHPTIDDAERAGFRPCKRCKPGGPSLEERYRTKVVEACREIEANESMPSLNELAKRAGASVYHFHRIFKAITGLTPRQYGAAHKARRVRRELPRSRTVTEAIYDSGFSSSGRFYEATGRILGMTPSAYRSGGAREEVRFAVGESSLGSILVAATERGLCAILMGDDPEVLVRQLQDRFPRAALRGGDAAFESVVARVVGFVEAPALGIDLPLDIRGTAFQQRVWQALREIAPGTTSSYAEIAKRIGSPHASRAVARACAANPLAVAIPCHRVVRRDGALSGYRWGVERKRTLLDKEGAFSQR